MGSQNVGEYNSDHHQALLEDLAALERMLPSGVFEDDVVRIGAEQEYFLVDALTHRAAPCGDALLACLGDEAFTTEMGRFNLEANLAPVVFTGGCLRDLEHQLDQLLLRLREAARAAGAEPLLTGILPSLRLPDLTLANLANKPRYHELNRIVMKLRGGAYSIYLKGLDELQLVHDNVMLETACTSFQLHLQVSPRNFAAAYNAAQAVAGPVLAAAVNSPLLLGQRLWQETRIALFQHAVDERPQAQVARSHPTRVSFGDAWVRDSVLEIWREQVARFRVILSAPVEEKSLDVLARGGVPELRALRLHNGSVWRWNRPCYGVTDGRPHLRIEFRALPAGPTVIDEVANAALLLGLVVAMPNAHGDIAARLPFESAKENFFAAARFGLKAQFDWFDGHAYPAAELLLHHLIPLAESGLRSMNIAAADIGRYLGVIRERVTRGQTGSHWVQAACAEWGTANPESRDRALVAATLRRQQTGQAVHRWSVPSRAELGEVCPETVAALMSTDLFTVAPGDPVALAASVMEWRHIRHLPVEDDDSRLVGLVSSRHFLPLVIGNKTALTVGEIMDAAPVTIAPESSPGVALALLRQHRLDCLPVVSNGRLVGLVTSHDLLNVLAGLLPATTPAPSSG